MSHEEHLTGGVVRSLGAAGADDSGHHDRWTEHREYAD
jgi:hypothetical protein